MSILIVKFGMPTQEMLLEADVAEAIMDDLAQVFGARLDYGWTDPVNEGSHEYVKRSGYDRVAD